MFREVIIEIMKKMIKEIMKKIKSYLEDIDKNEIIDFGSVEMKG